MIAFFEVLACLADSIIAVNFVSKANGRKITELKCMCFSLVYFAFNLIGVFAKADSKYIVAFNLVILLCLSLVTSSYKSFKAYVSPVCVVGFTLFVSMFIKSCFGVYLSLSYLEVDIELSSAGLPRVYYLIITEIVLFLILSFLIPIITKSVSFKIQDYFLMLLFPVTMFYVVLVMSASILAYVSEALIEMLLPARVMMLAGFLGIYCLIYRLGKNNSERERRILYQQMLGYEEKRYSDMENVLEQLRKIRHDLNHQLTLVKMKLSNKDYDGAEKELDGILENVSSVGTIIKTDNKIVDYMVNTKFGSLPYASVVVAGSLSELDCVDEMDLSIVLGNIIDNAVDAVKVVKDPRIELSFYPKDNYMNILCKNSIEESVLNKNPKLLSSKLGREKHGYGIKSVKEIICRINGDVSFYEEDGFFTVHIMLPMKY